VGREVFVRGVNVAAGTIELSQPLFAAAGTRTFTFERYRYLLDFMGFDNLSRLEMREIEFNGLGIASGVMLPTVGLALRFDQCVFNRPKDRAITSIGAGCQGMMVDTCQFMSNEQNLPVQQRTTVALNVNANDVKLRDCRVVRFAHFAIMGGSGHLVIGNHFFHGDDLPTGARRAGIVFTSTHARSLLTGNYIDNCYIEWSNEHDADPSFQNELSFGGLTISTNIFMAIDVASSFRWLVITPRGPGHFLNGFVVSDNAFRVVNGTVDRVETVDTTFASLDFGRMRNVTFEANTYHAVGTFTQSPLLLQHNQTGAADAWVLDGGAFLPFNSWARNVTAVVAEGAITTAGNTQQFVMPYTLVEQGPNRNQVQLRWPAPVKGRVNVTIRCDNPT
jgi:hypothetical protein